MIAGLLFLAVALAPGAATAQISEAPQAAVVACKAADAFLGQGPLGAIIVVLCLVIVGQSRAIVFLFRKLDGQSSTITTMVREATATLQANTSATTAGYVTISALDHTLQATNDGVEKLSYQTELAAQAAASRGVEILKNQEEIKQRLEDRIS